MKIKSIYAIVIIILSISTSCKQGDSKKKDSEEKAYYEFTPQDGKLAGKTFNVWEGANTLTYSDGSNDNVQKSEIQFFENRDSRTHFLIRWDGNSPRHIGSEEDIKEKGFIRLSCQEGDKIYEFMSEKATFTVTDKKIIYIEDKFTSTYPAYELEGNFDGIFTSQPSAEKVKIKGKLKLVNKIRKARAVTGED